MQEIYEENNIKNIEFTGKKNPKEISDLMNSSRLLLMASSFEAFRS